MREFLSTDPDHERLYARIVAWVLGEASAFEASELAEQCKADPRLQAFADEVREIHNLLGEAAATAADPGWRLSYEKRQGLNALLGTSAAIEPLPGWFRYRAVVMIAACLAAIAVAGFLVKSHDAKSLWAEHQATAASVAPRDDYASIEAELKAAPGPSSVGDERQPTVWGDAMQRFGNQANDAGSMADESGIPWRRQAGAFAEGAFTTRRKDQAPEEMAAPADMAAADADEALPQLQENRSRSTPAESRAKVRNFAIPDGAGAKEEATADHFSGPESESMAYYFDGAARARAMKDSIESRSATAEIPATPPPASATDSPTPGNAGQSLTRNGEAMSDELAEGLSTMSETRETAQRQELRDQETELGNRRKNLTTTLEDQGIAESKFRSVDRRSDSHQGPEVQLAPNQAKQGEMGQEKSVQDDLNNEGDRLGTFAYAGIVNDHGEDSMLRATDAQLKSELPAVTRTSPAPGGPLDMEAHQSNRTLGAGEELVDEALAPRFNVPVPDIAEIRTSDEPVSTFSLNVGDTSFKVAQAEIANGGRPDPAGIRVEQFYNAMDYADPAPASGEPIAAQIESSQDPVIPGRQLLRVGLVTAADGRVASQPLRLTLLIDQSGSMGREDRRAALAKAISEMAGLLTPDDRISVIGFARTPKLLAEGLAGGDPEELSSLAIAAAADGGTNLEEALKLARELALRHRLENAQNRVILFTDGAANLGNADPDRLSAQIADLRHNGISFDIAGMGTDDLNDRLLGEMARHGNGRYHAVGVDEPGDFAKRVAGAFRPAAENVKVQVRFNPARVASYRLVGFDADRLEEDDFHNDAVDAAEMAAGESGVALYQIETLPEGEGEIGEVSVRFKDTRSGVMVERSWTLRFDAATPAFDKAPPSMQLAGLAMLVGEKLRGGPLAEAIDFSKFSHSKSQVRHAYQTSSRVNELLQMIEAID